MSDWMGPAMQHLREKKAADLLNLAMGTTGEWDEARLNALGKAVKNNTVMLPMVGMPEDEAPSEGHEDKHPESPGASEGKPQS